MKLALRILMFGFLLNIATGIAINYIPELNNNPEHLNGMYFSENKIDAFSDEFNNTIKPTSDATDTTNLIDNVLDKLNLGIISKVQTWASQWLFGFTDMIGKQVLKLDDFTMGIINSLLIVTYVLAFINLFSGKDFGYG